MVYKEYIKELDRLYSVGNTTEHSFRGALASYLQEILKDFVVTNEPGRIECGAPDYVITRNNIPLAFIEAKDINDHDLEGRREHKEQFNRYKESLDRIVFTDYLVFHMFIGGEWCESVRIADVHGNRIVAVSDGQPKFEEMVRFLATGGRQKITSSSVLARHMASKAHLLAEAVNKRLLLAGEDSQNSIAAQLAAFRAYLIHDLKAEEFADIYAQTIVYGLFTARLNDATPEDFSRQEAANLIPKSNPFLRQIFQSIAGYDLDESIAWIVDDLVAMFAVTDAEKIMANYGMNKRHDDPIVHFYEDFLAEYDPKLRKARGVWYTPAPVVRFIVKSVDEILQKEFGLPMGLADDSMVTIDRVVEQSYDKRSKDGMKHEQVKVHRVQILDPATGTGTFLAEIINQIRDKFDGMEGMWPSYVEKSLIPRIHGFEILMASYTIAHLKLSLMLKATGYNNELNRRLNVFLTNSLEEGTPRASTLFASWLSNEANEANRVKLETPVMVAIGNPPYSISSQNNNKWINHLVEPYKSDLNEKNIQALSDDYVKFIRLGQYFIDKNGEGVLAFITNNSYLGGIVHRQMRLSLLKSFNKIFILNLHGYSLSGETSKEGHPDENVFDIMQGVSIGIFVKYKKKNLDNMADVFYEDLFGDRNSKYEYLCHHTIESICKPISVSRPNFFFIPKDLDTGKEYLNYLKITDLFIKYNNGIETGKDDFFLDFDTAGLRDRLSIAFSDKEEAVRKYNIEDSDNYRFRTKFMQASFDCKKIVSVHYRPFDIRACYYDTFLQRRPAAELMSSMLYPNLGIIAPRQVPISFQHCFVSNIPTGCNLTGSAKKFGSGPIFPLYIYLDDGTKVLNIREHIIKDFCNTLQNSVAPLDLIDYLYAILHSPSYCETYKEFLKIDFPRIPYPKDANQFHRLAEKGAEMRRLHLMEDAGSWPRVVSFPVTGDNLVDKVSYADGKVFINKEQYFGNVSELAWNFYIGGYQPAQKWLKDRKGRALDYQDILHYGRIIYALEQTDRIMKEIDKIGVI
jgi:predicted helicase